MNDPRNPRKPEEPGARREPDGRADPARGGRLFRPRRPDRPAGPPLPPPPRGAGRRGAERPDGDRSDGGRPERGRSEPGRSEWDRPQSGRSEPGRSRTSRAESGRPESGRPESGRSRSGRAAPQPGSGRPGSGRSVFGRPGSGRAAPGDRGEDRTPPDGPRPGRPRTGEPAPDRPRRDRSRTEQPPERSGSADPGRERPRTARLRSADSGRSRPRIGGARPGPSGEDASARPGPSRSAGARPGRSGAADPDRPRPRIGGARSGSSPQDPPVRPGRPGAAEPGPERPRAARPRSAEPRPGRSGAAERGAARLRPAEPGPARARAGGARSGPSAERPDASRSAPPRADGRRPRPPQARRGGGAGSGSRPPHGPGGPRPPISARPLRLGNPKPRLRLVSLGLAFLLVVFVGRLLQLQVVDASAYAAKAAVNRYVQVPLPADRGTITDRDGVRLATTVDAYDITADPYLFTPDQADIPDAPRRAAQMLAPVLGVGEKELVRKLSAQGSRYELLARQQSPQTWTQIKELKSKLSESGGNVLAGVFAQEHSKRVYPAGDLAAGVLGFVNSSGKGGGGLEQVLEAELSGRDGKRTYAQSGGRQVPTAGVQEQPAVPGRDVELTLDRDIQWAAQDAISAQVEESAADRGYVIVQDTRTGEVLAMASSPGFDPNDYSAADPGALGNPALQDVYEPGSVSKLMTMAAVLEEGVATWDTRITVPNTLRRADRVFHDDIDHPTWYLTLNGVLAKSSNLGTISVAEKLGRDQKESNRVLYDYLRKFGLGQETGTGFPGETAGILADPDDWSASQQYTIPFGQGLSVNALQATSVFSTVANGGVRVEPSLVRGSTKPDGRFVPAPKPDRSRVVSERNAKILGKMLESVVDDKEGTGTKAAIPGYRIAGKTGTANRVDPQTGRYSGYTASFMGFAPADDPRVTVSCVIQNPTRGSYFGGQICGPVFKKVMEFSLKSLEVPPTGAKAPKLPVSFKPGRG